MKILFLGVGKRLSLLERFQQAAAREQVELEMWAAETHENVPVRQVAHVVKGPLFVDPYFPEWLLRTVLEHEIDAVVPGVDTATVALSAHAHLLPEDCTAVVSHKDLCRVMEDKSLADQWFRYHDVPVPTSLTPYPALWKPRHGYGSRGIVKVHNEDEERALTVKRADYFRQPFVVGPEYTVDAYVDVSGRVVGMLSRERIITGGGEVMLSSTERRADVLGLARQVLAVWGWWGPITLQFMAPAGGPVITEVNPRFGGGVIHSIELGLDMPRWIVRELLGKSVSYVDDWPDGHIMTRCLRDVFLWPEAVPA